MSRHETADFLHLDEPSLGVAQASAAFEAGLFRHAFAVLNVLLQRGTSVPEAWYEKARWYQMLRFHEAAVRCFGRAVSLGPNPDAEIAMASSLAELRRYDEVIAVYDALLLRADDAESMEAGHANRGNAHAVMDHVEAAISDYEEAIRRGPNRATHYQNYARLFSVRKQWEKAASVLDRGLAAVPDDTKVPLLLEKARVSNEQEQADAGLAAADEVLSREPDHPRALYQRGWSLSMLGRLEEASVSMQKLVELEPTNEHAQRALAKLTATLAKVKPAKPWWKLWP